MHDISPGLRHEALLQRRGAHLHIAGTSLSPRNFKFKLSHFPATERGSPGSPDKQTERQNGRSRNRISIASSPPRTAKARSTRPRRPFDSSWRRRETARAGPRHAQKDASCPHGGASGRRAAGACPWSRHMPRRWRPAEHCRAEEQKALHFRLCCWHVRRDAAEASSASRKLSPAFRQACRNSYLAKAPPSTIRPEAKRSLKDGPTNRQDVGKVL